MIDITRAASPAEALGLVNPPALVALVGGGGKSSLMFALGRGLPGRVVMTTTTRIFAAQMSRAAEVCTLAEENWWERLYTFDSSLLVVGGVEGDRARGVPPELPAKMLACSGVDWVVIEADGSRMLPVKAPAALQRQYIQRLLDHADRRLVAALVRADSAGVDLCDVLAKGAEDDLLFQIDHRFR